MGWWDETHIIDSCMGCESTDVIGYKYHHEFQRGSQPAGFDKEKDMEVCTLCMGSTVMNKNLHFIMLDNPHVDIVKDIIRLFHKVGLTDNEGERKLKTGDK